MEKKREDLDVHVHMQLLKYSHGRHPLRIYSHCGLYVDGALHLYQSCTAYG